MDDDMLAQIEASKDWDRARQAAVVEEVMSVFSRRQIGLLSFDDVRERLHLTQKSCRGLQEIAVSRIRGSVGRYQDFTHTFMPRRDELRQRWQRVNVAASLRGLPPIEVYQVGEAYFVMDGNHRVSIARRNGMATIPAYVWQYESPVGLSGEADLDEVLIKAEYAAFLRATRLDALRPEQNIVFTTPGRYLELQAQIDLYQQVLEQIDGEPVAYADALTAWYDMVYTPAVEVIRERGVLEHFPGRTEADLFVWVWRYHQELATQGIPSLAEAADQVGKRAGRPLPTRIWQAVASLLRSRRH